MYTERVFQLGDEYILTNAGMGNVMNTILMLKTIYNDLHDIEDLVKELNEQGYKTKLITIDKITNW